MTAPSVDHHQRIARFIQAITERFGKPVSVVIRKRGTERTHNMAFEQRENSGSIWINDRKEQDTQPDRTGSAKIGGRDWWVNGWLRKTNDGKPYLALSFKLKEPKQAPPPATAKSHARAGDLDDDPPF